MPFRLILLCLVSTLFLACKPPIRTAPRRVVTGLPPTQYVAVLENSAATKIVNGQYLAGIRVKDRGWSRDCEYPEVVERARNKALALGANMLVIREHQLPDQTSSSCSRIRADMFLVPSLEGLESQIRWHPARPLLPGDLRGREQAGLKLPPVHCVLKYRLLGDYFNAVLIRTQVFFLTDSTWSAGDPGRQALLLRRAQLQFNLAELEARKFKSVTAALAPDLRTITGQAKMRLAERQAVWQKRAGEFDAAWSQANYSAAVLAEWEKKAAAELAETAALEEDVTVSLKKKDAPPK